MVGRHTLSRTSYLIQASLRDTGLNLPVDSLSALPVTAIVPAITGSGGTVTYSSLTGTGATVTYGASSLADTSAAFPTPNGLAGRTVYVAGATGVVQSNTARQLRSPRRWNPGTPTNGATYVIARLTDTSKNFAVNSLAGRTVMSGNNTAVVHSNSATTLTLKHRGRHRLHRDGAAYTITRRLIVARSTPTPHNRLTLTGGWCPFTPPPGPCTTWASRPRMVLITSNTATVMTLTSPVVARRPAGRRGLSGREQPTNQPLRPGLLRDNDHFRSGEAAVRERHERHLPAFDRAPLFLHPQPPPQRP